MRILVVLADPVTADGIRQRCSLLVAEGYALAICYIVSAQSPFECALDAQRKLTMEVRRALDLSAEAIPVFIVTQGDGDRVEDYAHAWGATEVQT